MAQPTIVVTGSESFIGREFRREAEARGLACFGLDLAAPVGPSSIAVDIRSPSLADAIPDGAEAIVHLAAISRDQDCRQDPALAMDVNVRGTVNVLQAATARRARQVVFASSEWVYGEVGSGDVQTEEQAIDATRLQSEYALSKLIGEGLLRLGSREGGPSVTVLRFGIVYGPRTANWSAVEALCHAVRTQETVTVGSVATARRFVHVRDIATGICHSLGRSGYEVFNLSGDRLISLRDVIETSAAVFGRSPRIVERSPGQASIRNPENRKAREQLGWRPVIGLEDGLRTLAASEDVAACR